MPRDAHATKLVDQLALAYSGELAAAYAYRGHWRAVRDPEERASIRKIEEEEWHHRLRVGALLRGLGGRPRFIREVRAWLVGRTLGLLCHVSGWFLPMYFAGRLESRNVVAYFRSKVEGHAALRRFPLWPPLPSRETIRSDFSLGPQDRPRMPSGPAGVAA
jgi:hypothetical protein